MGVIDLHKHSPVHIPHLLRSREQQGEECSDTASHTARRPPLEPVQTALSIHRAAAFVLPG
jgi:hypothetical protein